MRGRVGQLDFIVKMWQCMVKIKFYCRHVKCLWHACKRPMRTTVLTPPSSALYHTDCCIWRINQPHANPRLHKHLPRNKMAPSFDQNSSTSTPTDPDLHLTPTHQTTPSLPATPSMHTHSPTPRPSLSNGKPRTNMEWSLFSPLHRRDSELCLLLVHPRPAMAWNKVTQTPSLPMPLKSPPQPTPYQMP